MRMKKFRDWVLISVVREKIQGYGLELCNTPSSTRDNLYYISNSVDLPLHAHEDFFYVPALRELAWKLREENNDKYNLLARWIDSLDT